jgi:hypothetical protein
MFMFMFIVSRMFLRWRILSPTPNPKAGGPPLVFRQRLLFQYILKPPPPNCWRPSLHPQPEDAPCCGDKGTHLTCYERILDSLIRTLLHSISWEEPVVACLTIFRTSLLTEVLHVFFVQLTNCWLPWIRACSENALTVRLLESEDPHFIADPNNPPLSHNLVAQLCLNK